MNANVIEKTTPFEFRGRTYQLKMTMWTEAGIVAEFGGVEKALQGKDALRNLGKMLAMFINQAVIIHNEENPNDVWEPVTAEYLMQHLPGGHTADYATIVAEVIKQSRPEVDEDELTDEEKNAHPSK